MKTKKIFLNVTVRFIGLLPKYYFFFKNSNNLGKKYVKRKEKEKKEHADLNFLNISCSRVRAPLQQF